MQIKERIESGLKLNQGIFSNFWTPEAMELHERTKIKITKDENGENVPHLEITEVVLIHCTIVNNNYLQN